MNVDFSDSFLGFRTHVLATTVCTAGGVHTLTCCTHIFLRTARSLRISHIFMRVTHTHGSSVMKKRCLSHECLRSLSRFLQPHVSPVTVVLVHPLRHHLSVHNLAVLSRPKSAGHAQRRTCIAKFGYLAKSDANTGNEPNEFDKNNSVDDDTMLINDPNHNFSDFSKTTSENTGQFGVPTVFESSVSHVSHDDFALQIESRESMQSGNRCWTERKRRKKRFCDQCCRVDVKER